MMDALNMDLNKALLSATVEHECVGGDVPLAYQIRRDLSTVAGPAP